MSERDPIRDLENFGTGGVPVTPLSPAEVRRLGDRRRTRRNALAAAGAVAAVVLVATPFAFVGGGAEKPTPPSTTITPTVTDSGTATPKPAPPNGWVTTIPEKFPLLAGFPGRQEDGSSPTVSDDRVIDPLTMCDQGFWSYEGVKQQRSTVFEQPEDVRARMILTYANDVAAGAALATARDTARACRVEDGMSGDPAEVVHAEWQRAAAGADETLVVTTNYRMPGTTSYMPGQTTWLMARVGNAIYLTSEYGEGGAGVDGAESGVDQTFATAAPMTAAMCIYAVDPCGGPSDGPSDGAAATTTIPADFPIGLGSPDLGSDAKVNGTPAGERMTHADPCDSKGILVRPAVDRLDRDLEGSEFTEQREVRTFADAATAQAALDNLESAAAGCATETLDNGIKATWTVLDEQTGYHSVTVARTIGIEGGYTWQYTRVGLAIFAVVWSGEGGSPEQIRINAGELTAITKQVAPAMCPFTQAGC